MEFIIILFLLILNGIFAMYEIALVSSSKARLETLVNKGQQKCKRRFETIGRTGKISLHHSNRHYSDRHHIGCLWRCSHSRRCGVHYLPCIPGVWNSMPKTLAMITTVAVITYLSLIIGELVPKSIALEQSGALRHAA